MKYKLYEKLTDFFRSRIFTKTNLALIAVFSVVLNVAMAGLTYKEHKDYVMMSSLYAAEEEVAVVQTTASETTYPEITTSVSEADEPMSHTEASTEAAQTENREDEPEEQTTSEAVGEEAQQGTYYVTNSGTKYHKGLCGYLSKSKNAISLSDAKARGYTPCSRCIK